MRLQQPYRRMKQVATLAELGGLGVSLKRAAFLVGKHVHLGTFATAEEAHAAHLSAKSGTEMQRAA